MVLTNKDLPLNVMSDENENINFIKKCYWCFDSNSVMVCRNCQRNFCRFCIKIKNIEGKETFACLMCGCLEVLKEMSGEKPYTEDRELMHLLHRYDDLYGNNKLFSDVDTLIEEIETISVKELPNVLNIVHDNIISMLLDVESLQSMVDQAIFDDKVDCIKDTLLPLFKVMTKHHLFNRLGKSSHNKRLCEKSDDVSSCKIDLECLRNEKSPMSVGNNEVLIASETKIVDADECTDLKLLNALNVDPVHKMTKNTFLNQCDIIKNQSTSSCIISSNKGNNQSSTSWLSRLPNMELVSVKKEPLEVEIPKKKLIPYDCKRKRSSANSPKSVDLSKFEKIDAPKLNPHLVAPANIFEEKSFIIKSVNDDDLGLVPPTHKSWSWERGDSKLLIPIKNAKSLNGNLTNLSQKKYDRKSISNSDFKLELFTDTELSAFDELFVAPVRKRGRPRKYFSNYSRNVNVSQGPSAT